MIPRPSLAPRTLGWLLLCAALLTVPCAAALAQSDHLVLTKVFPRIDDRFPNGSPFISLVNHTGAPVEVSDYYLCTAEDRDLQQHYFNIVTGVDAGGGTSGNFHVRFPQGMTVADGDTVVIALAGNTAFAEFYGFQPDLELFEDGVEPDAVPDMRAAHPGGIRYGLGTDWVDEPLMSEVFDSVVLYRWDGAGNLVTDVDYLVYGSSERPRVDKTDVVIDGSAYNADTPRGSQIPARNQSIALGRSFARTGSVEIDETTTGGNGVGGHDETSEDLAAGWEYSTDGSSPAPPANPYVPAPIVIGALNTPAYAGAPVTVQATLVAFDGVQGVTFHYRTDPAAAWTDLAGTGSDETWSAQIPAQAEGVTVAWFLTAAGTGGGLIEHPAGGGLHAFEYTVAAAGAGPVKLLLSEISVIGTPEEYIEVVNPSGDDVDLSDYYLTDAIFSPGDQYYWRITEGNPSVDNVGGGVFGDFHARFPDGFSIGAGDTILVSVAGSDAFLGSFGGLPDLELYEDGAEADAVPDMRPVWGDPGGANSIVGPDSTPGLSNASESVTLYYWDGVSDLVTDIDVFFWGTDDRWRYSKTGVTMGSSTYQNETLLGAQTPFLEEATAGNSFHRIDSDEIGQPGPPGNGVDARDEVGEPFPTTFALAPYDPAMVPPDTPVITGAGPVSAPVADEPVTIAIQVMAAQPLVEVLLFYAVDGGTEEQVAAVEAGDVWEAVIPGQPIGTVVTWYATATDDENDQGVYPTGAPGVTESYTVQASVSEAVKLLFSEISVIGTEHEFVEIFNPSDQDVDLSDFYLADAIYAPGSQYYWRIAEGNPTQATVGGGAFGDFHARFPAGFTIAAGDTIVITMPGSNAFAGAFGFAPHLEMFEDGAEPDDIPDMRPVWGDPDGDNSVVGADSTPGLSNASETLVLYHWDGFSNLVTDIDVFFWGDDDRWRFSKTGVSVGGSTYEDETAIGAQDPFLGVASVGSSYHRSDFDETGQPGPPGNGVASRDEVGEPLTATFELAPYSPAQGEQAGILILGTYVSPAFADSPVTLYISVTNPAEVDSAVMNWRLLPDGDFAAVEGVPYGANGFAAPLPGQAAGDSVAWYWRLVDTEGVATLYPDGGASAARVTVYAEPPPPEERPVHLLLSEVGIGGSGRQFIEIHNPTDQTVLLDDYYMSDSIYGPNNQFYWNLARFGFLPGSDVADDANSSQIGGGAYGDWHARFPAGAEIGPNDVITISVSGSLGFVNAYGVLPDYELWEDGSRPDEVPDLRWVFGDEQSNSIFGDYGSYFSYPEFDSSEIVVLYHWGGVTDTRVTDIDVLAWGDDENARFSKNLLVVGGVTYGPETPVGQQQPTLDVPAGDESYQRVEPEEIGEIQLGAGNGTGGHDETSEQFAETWNVQPPNPGDISQRVEGRVGEAALKVPPRTFLPTMGERFEIQFTTRSRSETTLRILDLEGRLVITLYDSRFDGPASVYPGQYSVRSWDGRDQTFERVKAGMYVAHLQVVDRQTGDKETKTAPVVVATRLDN